LIGYLIQKSDSPLLVYDYAVCGDSVHKMKYQVKEQFMETAGKKPDYCPWDSENSLFSTSLISLKTRSQSLLSHRLNNDNPLEVRVDSSFMDRD
jgi:hypothetical protein